MQVEPLRHFSSDPERRIAMKRAWEPVKLRVAWGDVPEPSDVLELRTGRRYQVLRVAGKTLHCVVLPVGHEVERWARVLPWQWASRRTRPR